MQCGERDEWEDAACDQMWRMPRVTSIGGWLHVTCVEKAGQRDEGEYIDLGGTLARE